MVPPDQRKKWTPVGSSAENLPNWRAQTSGLFRKLCAWGRFFVLDSRNFPRNFQGKRFLKTFPRKIPPFPHVFRVKNYPEKNVRKFDPWVGRFTPGHEISWKQSSVTPGYECSYPVELPSERPGSAIYTNKGNFYARLRNSQGDQIGRKFAQNSPNVRLLISGRFMKITEVASNFGDTNFLSID
jgi:hypothetical protein